MSLSPDQQRALDMCLQGNNVFITGGAGVGKSHLTKLLVSKMREQGKTVRMTASTGVAASLVNGQTLHSLLGLGLADAPLDDLIRMALRRKPVVKIWREMDVLVIDEISMIDPAFFHKVDKIAGSIRGNPHESFGGLQVLLVGDFFQLPPVPNRNSQPGDPKFVFESDSWRETVDNCIELTQIFRQDDESPFAQMLRRIRRGELTLDDTEMLFNRVKAKPVCAPGVTPTHMYARRNNVHELNQKHLDKLESSTSVEYVRTVKTLLPNGQPGQSTTLTKFAADVQKNMQAPAVLHIREGAQVMMLVNCNEMHLVNGSRGVVTGFVDGYPQVRFKNRTAVIQEHSWEYNREFVGDIVVTQVPLQLAWAVTIHKGQGTSLDCAEIALDRSVFEYGQAYVALSRVRSLEGLTLSSLDQRVIRADPKVTQFYAELAKRNASQNRKRSRDSEM